MIYSKSLTYERIAFWELVCKLRKDQLLQAKAARTNQRVLAGGVNVSENKGTEGKIAAPALLVICQLCFSIGT